MSIARKATDGDDPPHAAARTAGGQLTALCVVNRYEKDDCHSDQSAAGWHRTRKSLTGANLKLTVAFFLCNGFLHLKLESVSPAKQAIAEWRS